MRILHTIRTAIVGLLLALCALPALAALTTGGSYARVAVTAGLTQWAGTAGNQWICIDN